MLQFSQKNCINTVFTLYFQVLFDLFFLNPSSFLSLNDRNMLSYLCKPLLFCPFHQGSFNSFPLCYFRYSRSFLLPYVYCTHFNQLTSSSYVICLTFSRNSVHFLHLLLKQKPSYCLKSLELYINHFFLNCSDPTYF